MIHQPPGPSEVVCVFGIRNSGKTHYVREETRGHDRFLVMDFRMQFGPEHGVVGITEWEALKEYFERGKPTRFRVAFQPVRHVEAFPLVCLLVKALGEAYGSLTFAVDEVSFYCEATHAPTEFVDLIARGRHYGVSLWVTAQRPAQVSRLLTSQASRFICFTTHEPLDLRTLGEHIGEKASELPNLPFRHPLIHDFEHLTPKKELDTDDPSG